MSRNVGPLLTSCMRARPMTAPSCSPTIRLADSLLSPPHDARDTRAWDSRRMSLNRRQLIQRGAAGAAVVVIGDLGSLFPSVAGAAHRPFGTVLGNDTGLGSRAAAGYGALVPDPAKLIDLPEGFSYTIVSEAGTPLTGTDGVIPDRFDGTAYFELDGRSFLVRNSEQDVESTFPAVAAANLTYDPMAEGGTTTVELDSDGTVIAEYVSLAGTNRNCAGGRPRGERG